MILAIDIGNTNAVIGIFKGEEKLFSFRIASEPRRTADELAFNLDGMFRLRGIDPKDIDGSIISSVVPAFTDAVCKAVNQLTGASPLVIGPGVKTGLNILYDDPKEVGADRIVNAVGAIDKYSCPLIIIDLGTATTFCVVDSNKNYRGGVIAPGIAISAEALFLKAAKLPKVELSMPEHFLNKNTVDSIRSGLLYGAVGQIDYITSNLKQESGIPEAKVIATGGLAEVIADKSEEIDIVDQDLTLWGLVKIYEKNTNRR